jgi:hypothetical protein
MPEEKEKKESAPPAAVKQAVITSETTRTAATPRRLRFPGLTGAYRGVRFSDEGVSEGPVPEEIERELRAQFPDARIEPVE